MRIRTITAAAAVAALSIGSFAGTAAAAEGDVVRVSQVTGYSGSNSIAVFDEGDAGIKYQIGGSDVSGRFITYDGETFIRELARLSDGTVAKDLLSNYNPRGANETTAKIYSNGTRVAISGAGAGGKMLIDFQVPAHAERFEQALDAINSGL